MRGVYMAPGDRLGPGKGAAVDGRDRLGGE